MYATKYHTIFYAVFQYNILIIHFISQKILICLVFIVKFIIMNQSKSEIAAFG